MSRDVAGIYTLVPVVNPVVPDTIIATSWANPTLNDLAQALTESLDRNGRGSMLAPLNMSNFPINSVGPAALPTDAPNAKQVRDLAFSWLTNVASDAPGNAITATALLSAPPVNGTQYAFVPDKVNAGAVTLNVNGGGAVPVLTSGGALTGGVLAPGKMVVLIFNAGVYNLLSGGNIGVNTVSSSDPQMMTSTQPTPGNTLLTLNSNVTNGTVKLDAAGKIPITLLPVDGLTLLGIWDAAPGTLPPVGTISGQYYLISPGGNLNLFVTNGAGGWVQQVVPVTNGDAIVWVNTVSEPVGWYRLIRAVANTAANIINVATPSFVATNLQSWINSADSPSGMLLANATRKNAGYQRGGSWVTGAGQVMSGNLYNDGAWKFVGIGAFGWLRTATSTQAIIDYISTVSSPGVDAAASLIQVWETTTTYAASFLPQFGVGGVPRAPGGQAFHIDCYGAGSRRFVFQDTTAQVGFKVVAAASGGFLDVLRMDATGANIAAAGVPMSFRLLDPAGAIITAIKCNPSGLVQIGDNTQPVPGSISSTYKNLGAIAGTLDFTTAQSIGVNPGGSVTAITLADGQIGRMIVNGGGSVALPAALKLPKGGAQWGLASTVVGMINTGGVLRATFTPYDA